MGRWLDAYLGKSDWTPLLWRKKRRKGHMGYPDKTDKTYGAPRVETVLSVLSVRRGSDLQEILPGQSSLDIRSSTPTPSGRPLDATHAASAIPAGRCTDGHLSHGRASGRGVHGHGAIQNRFKRQKMRRLQSPNQYLLSLPSAHHNASHLFRWQIRTFGAGVLLLVVGIAGSVSEKLLW